LDKEIFETKQEIKIKRVAKQENPEKLSSEEDDDLNYVYDTEHSTAPTGQFGML
jgi:hypothetical protein